MSPINSSQYLYFPSKRDWWIVALIWLGVVVSVAGGLVRMRTPSFATINTPKG